jgi:hypothetical protein
MLKVGIHTPVSTAQCQTERGEKKPKLMVAQKINAAVIPASSQFGRSIHAIINPTNVDKIDITQIFTFIESPILN